MEQVASTSIASRSDASLAGLLSLIFFFSRPFTPRSPGNAVAPAGAADQNASPFTDPVDDTFVTTTPAGVPVAPLTAAPPTEPEQPPQSDSTPPPAPPKPPLYKRRWFIITSVIGACIGIALLFIILFPVVRAIIQDVVNKTTLDITTAAITNPSNTS